MRGSRGGRAALAVGVGTLLVVGTDLFVVSPLLPALADTFRVGPGVAGGTVTAFSIAYVLAAPWFGALADRIGRRRVLVAGLLAFALANLLTGLAPWFAALLAARVLAGLSAAAVSPAVYALVGASAPAGRRGTWMAAAVAGFLVALTTGAPSGIALAALWGWRAVFVVLAVLAAALAAVNAVAWPGAAAPVRVVAPAPVGPLGRARAVSVAGLWGFAVYALYTYLGTGLSRDGGLPGGLVALALVGYGAGAVAGSLCGGRLADRYGAARVATVSLCLTAALLPALDPLLHAPPVLLLVGLFLFALCAYPCLPAHQARLVARFPARGGSLLAWNSSAMYLGTSLGAAAGGVLLSAAGFRAVPPVAAGVALLGAACSAWWAIPRASVAGKE